MISSTFYISPKLYFLKFDRNKTEVPSFPYAGQGYVRVINVTQMRLQILKKNPMETYGTKRNPRSLKESFRKPKKPLRTLRNP